MITEDLRKKLTGVHAYLVTPFTEKDEINVEGLRENIQFLTQNNVSVIVPSGGTGEFDSLTQEERKKARKFKKTSTYSGITVSERNN